MTINFMLNSRPVALDVAPDRRVIDLLREDLGLTGAKDGCGAGECGACAVLLNGRARQACLLLAAQLQGLTLVTIEGLAAAPAGQDIVEAFVTHGAVQCGFCTPGMAIGAQEFLEQRGGGEPSRREIRAALSGHLCRCTGHQKIVDAVQALAANACAPVTPVAPVVEDAP